MRSISRPIGRGLVRLGLEGGPCVCGGGVYGSGRVFAPGGGLFPLCGRPGSAGVVVVDVRSRFRRGVPGGVGCVLFVQTAFVGAAVGSGVGLGELVGGKVVDAVGPSDNGFSTGAVSSCSSGVLGEVPGDGVVLVEVVVVGVLEVGVVEAEHDVGVVLPVVASVFGRDLGGGRLVVLVRCARGSPLR